MTKRAFLRNMRDWSAVDVRRWVVGAVAIPLVGYAVITATALLMYDFPWQIAARLGLATGICGLAFLLTMRGHFRTGVAIALGATWLEIQIGFLTKPEVIGPAIVVLPTLVVGFGLLGGARAAFAATALTVLATTVTHRMSPQFRDIGFTALLVYWLVLHAIGMFSGWVIVVLSLKGFRRMFARLRAEQQDLSDTIRFAPDGMLVVNQENAVIIVNPAAEAILRMTTAGIIGRSIGDVLAEAAGEPEAALVAPSDTGETPMALHWVAGDGTAMYVEATWRRMEGGRREVLLRDVSARRRLDLERFELEAQTARTQRLEAVGQLAAGLSHDFNNILTAIGALAELLRTETDAAVRGELVDELAAARARGAVLTRQLLAFANRDVVLPRLLDLGVVLRALESRLRERLTAGQTLSLTTDAGCWVRADETQIAQAVENLVSNARDAMEPDGRCTVTVELHTATVGVPQVRVRVTDTGSGMTPAVAERAFEPFFTTKGRGQGTGLGLTVVHALVMQSGGVARIHSAVGKGTRIEIDLPLVASPRPSPSHGSAPVASTRRTILLAEDDDGTRSTIARLLRREGYLVIEARDGTEGLHLAMTVAEPIHMLLTDVMMPGLSGPALAERVREVYESLPVLFMTGYAEQDVAAQLGSVRTGRELLVKPFAPGELVASVERLLRVRQDEGVLSA